MAETKHDLHVERSGTVVPTVPDFILEGVDRDNRRGRSTLVSPAPAAPRPHTTAIAQSKGMRPED